MKLTQNEAWFIAVIAGLLWGMTTTMFVVSLIGYFKAVKP